jgi:lipopolysaccharide export system permease protein
MTLLDRYILRSAAINYLIALAVMMGLYIVLDLFFNMDEFTEQSEALGSVLANVASYYGANLFRYFAQLSGVVTLFACMATLARMRKANELTAMLASGMSLYRVAAPVLAFGILTTGLWVFDTEVAIPGLAPKLARRHDDARGEKTYGVWFLEDRGGALLSAQQFLPGTGTMRRMLVLKRDERGNFTSAIEAEEAVWEKLDGHPLGGRWVLTRGLERSTVTNQENSFGPQEMLVKRRVDHYESNLDPAKIQLRQSAQWISFLSSRQLSELSKRDLPANVAVAVQQTRHARFAVPIVNLLLLLLGIPFLLNRDPGTILSDAAKCLGVCGACFAIAFAGQSVMSPDTYSALPAWLPIIAFSPLAVVLIDRIRT